MKFHSEFVPHTSELQLFVSDLNRSTNFYQKIIGFKILTKSNDTVVFTTNGKTPLLTIEQTSTKRVYPSTGLYHFALLVPERKHLANVLRHLLSTGYPLQGASDHSVSEAIYLADPDGNGIEIYVDRPSKQWNWEEDQVMMTTKALNVEELMKEVSGVSEELPENTVLGHVHLQVSDLKEAKDFYQKGLGLQIVSQFGYDAIFASYGGYHHHIGLNTWQSAGALAPKERSTGLKWFSIVFTNDLERNKRVEQVKKFSNVWEKDDDFYTKDPSGNMIRLSLKK
ncbi:VOC family protein [Alkalihalobacillus hwajinpoensis]|uniref:VOC family protein n=1 Tax=Guptibacillus hwajinpoensis TaxID=208199 RepID=UPI0018848964|nr:VOC family protein [Pseudalkalibacillus hwajinpoensis]MBF0709432.1 VOC family protein [Pseudalkalibacillus hwajinpoensis]